MWITPAYKSLVYTDTMHHPQRVSVKIMNSNDDGKLNTEENNFNRYQQVRIKEGNSNKYLFYGKVDKVTPSFDEAMGQILTIEASDNLMELMKNSVNSDANYTGDVSRATVIKDLINGGTEGGFTAHAQSGNIGTPDNDEIISGDSIVTDGGQLSYKLRGSKKNVLRVIEELSESDYTSDSDGERDITSFDFFLDNPDFPGENTDSLITPNFNYFARGEKPVLEKRKTKIKVSWD